MQDLEARLAEDEPEDFDSAVGPDASWDALTAAVHEVGKKHFGVGAPDSEEL